MCRDHYLTLGKNSIFPLTAWFFTVPPDFTTQMRLNGALDSQPVMKKRRGRRKNVEGMDLLFMNKSRVPAVPDQVNICFMFLVV